MAAQGARLGAGVEVLPSHGERYSMGRNHLLIEKAFVYERSQGVQDPENSVYDDRLGAWVSEPGGEFLAKSNNPGRQFPRTKKGDQETGEDQKGE